VAKKAVERQLAAFMTFVPSIRICQAEDFAGTMWCGRCNISWPTAAMGDAVPDCRDKPEPAVTLTEMIETVHCRAHTDIGSQVVLVKAGLRDGPDMPTLRRAAADRDASRAGAGGAGID
jgi:hypothetical protein